MSKSEYMFAKKNEYPLNVLSPSETPFRFPRKIKKNASQVLQEELGLSGPHHWIS